MYVNYGCISNERAMGSKSTSIYSEDCFFLVFLSMLKIIATWWLNANSSPSTSLTEISRSNLPSLICLDVTRTANHSTPSSGRAVLTSRFMTTVGNHMPARCSSLALRSLPSGVLPAASPLRDACRSWRSSGAAKNSCRLNWGTQNQPSSSSVTIRTGKTSNGIISADSLSDNMQPKKWFQDR